MNGNILLALTSAVFNASNDLIYRKVSVNSRVTSQYPFYFLSSASACIIAFIFTLFNSSGFSGQYFGAIDIFFGVILGALSFVTYILFLMSFSGTNTSVCVTIYRMNLIPGILFAILFLGEVISVRRGAAILCCVVGVLFLSSLKFGKLSDNRHIFLSVGACVAGGVLNFVNKLAVAHGGNSFKLLFIRFLVVTLLAGIFIIIKKSFKFNKKTVIYALFSGLFLMLAVYFVLQAFKTGDVAFVLPIAQLSFTIIVIISWIFLKEKMNIMKIIGIAFAIISVLLMN